MVSTSKLAKAANAVARKAPVKRSRFITLSGARPSINRELGAKVKALAGWKSYVTNLDRPVEFVIGTYHQLWHVEHAFRMSKSDLKARPVCHHKKESIDAHLAVVFAALAVSHHIEQATGWTIKKSVRTFRQYRYVTLTVAGQTITASQPIPAEHTDTLAKINNSDAH